MIKAVLIDDEQIGVLTLSNLLREYCPQVTVIATAGTVDEGVDAIRMHKPDIVFLDITMGAGDGFEVLERAEEKNFEVIFVTAHHEYAARAFELAALHYLLKPVNVEELQKAVERYERFHQVNVNEKRLEILKSGLNNDFRRLALPTQEGITFIDIDDVIRCEASQSYTIFYMSDKSQIVVSKSLSTYEKLLANSFFCRLHDKHLVNLRHVKKYLKGKGGQAILSDGTTVDVSVRRKEEFIAKVEEFMINLHR